ncbi:MAG TPA: hypothetical protein PLZ58_03015 [Candidatus Saccharibacteria bacterium]|nr:hypothetical protein [Candidatus Saccharibacteria bacterium]
MSSHTIWGRLGESLDYSTKNSFTIKYPTNWGRLAQLVTVSFDTAMPDDMGARHC